MTTQHPLALLKEALQQPFAPETIQFLPKEIHQEQGQYVCLALPYANKRIYEDRLNELIFGEWSTPYTEPYAQGNKLIIPATVIVLGIAHTDYGEAYFTTTSKNGNTREDDNTATEAYSQAFRRACAKFFLGRYLYDLPKLTLPYHSELKQIAISKAERIAWVEKLYQARGLLPKVYTVEAKSSVVPQFMHLPQKSDAPTATPAQPLPSSNDPLSTAQPPEAVQAPQQRAATTRETPATSYPTSYPNDTFLDWVCRTVNRDQERIGAICRAYNVTHLSQLSATQRQNLTRRQKSLPPVPQEPPTSEPAAMVPPSPLHVQTQNKGVSTSSHP